MRLALGFFLLFACTVLVAGLSDDEYLIFGTKTRYHIQHKGEYTPPPPGCTPVQINLLARHGTRYPSKSDIRKLEKFYVNLRANVEHIKNETFAWVKSWGIPFEHHDDKRLHPVGETEQYEIGKRFAKAFPELFDKPYSPTEYHFVSTQTSRSTQSAAAFGFGLFEGRGSLGRLRYQPVAVVSESIYNDKTLRFFDNCPNYATHVKDRQDEVLAERKKLGKSAPMADLVVRVAHRLGSYPEYVPSVKDVLAMYVMCAFDVALNEDDKWCKVFEASDLRLLDYHADLKSFYVRGAGTGLNVDMSCPLLADIAGSLKGRVDGSEPLRAVLRFAHAETLLPLVALLGLYEENVTLTADNYNEAIHQRVFRSREIAPFSANLAFALYNCTASSAESVEAHKGGEGYSSAPHNHHHHHHQSVDRFNNYVIKVLLNEREQQLPFCRSLYCPLPEFLREYSEELACDFTRVCGVGPSSHFAAGIASPFSKFDDASVP
eukprot:Colp12_sorted_trinity150504_noHs@9509